jgi:hypothetical protein
MAKRAQSGKSAKSKETKAESYRYPEAESPLCPEAGTQAQFKKKKPPVTYRYDSSISPALEWDGQNHARSVAVRMRWRAKAKGTRLVSMVIPTCLDRGNRVLDSLGK